MSVDVSLLMAAYNPCRNYPAGMFEHAVQSTLDQAGVQVEICLRDDGSDDHEAWPALDDSRLIVRRSPTRYGAAAAYQAAAEIARGRYCLQQSVRTWFDPGALQRLAGALDAHPEVGFVYGQTQYHGALEFLNIPEPFERSCFFQRYDPLFGLMYRHEALEAGCEYVSYLERDGWHIDISDWDFVMQMIVRLGWQGLALRDHLCAHYFYSGQGQMTALVHQYQAEIDAIFRQRWGTA